MSGRDNINPQQFELPFSEQDRAATFALPPPHRQTMDEFSRRPDVMWHGRHSDQLVGPEPPTHPGFHVGTEKAAQDRLRDTGPRRERTRLASGMVKHQTTDDPGRMYPLRITETMLNLPEAPVSDHFANETTIHRPEGGYYYRNEGEDIGSISAVLPDREGVQSQPQAVEEARKVGHEVPHHVLWEKGQLARQHGHKVEFHPGMDYAHPARPEIRNREPDPELFRWVNNHPLTPEQFSGFEKTLSDLAGQAYSKGTVHSPVHLGSKKT